MAKLMTIALVSSEMLDSADDGQLDSWVANRVGTTVKNSIHTLRKKARQADMKPSEYLTWEQSQSLEPDAPVIIENDDECKVGICQDDT